MDTYSADIQAPGTAPPSAPQASPGASFPSMAEPVQAVAPSLSLGAQDLFNLFSDTAQRNQTPQDTSGTLSGDMIGHMFANPNHPQIRQTPQSQTVSPGSLQAYAQPLVEQTFPNDPGAWAAFNAVVNRESGWNPAAANPTSSARGLGQFLSSTSQNYGLGSDMSQVDPETQVQATIDYIRNRYGTPSDAWQSEQTRGWY